MNITIFRSQFLAPAVMLLCALAPALAQAMPMSEAEFVTLPDVCRNQGNVTEKNRPPYPREVEYRSLLGSSYADIHHYCWALVKFNRSYQRNLTEPMRRSIYAQALGDLDYVLERSNADMPMRTEILATREKILLVSGELPEAKKTFDMIVANNPRYWRAYFYLANYLAQKGRRADALAILDEGLKHVPESTVLKKLANDLKGGADK